MADYKKNIGNSPGRFIGVQKDTDSDTTYTAGDGLDLSGTTFSTDVKADSGIVIDSTELAMDLGASSITGTLAVGDGGTGLATVGTDEILTGNGSGALTSESALTFTTSGLQGLKVQGALPVLYAINTGASSFGGSLSLYNYRGVTQQANVNDDILGQIQFVGGSSTSYPTYYGYIKTTAENVTHTDQAGKMVLQVGTSNGTATGLQDGVSLTGTATTNLVNVGIGYGTDSLTTVAGNLTVTNDLMVSGTTTTLNTANLNVEDKNIRLNYHLSGDTSSTADGAGITIQDAVDASTDAFLSWTSADAAFSFSHSVYITGDLKVKGGDIYGPVDGDLAIHTDGNLEYIIDEDDDETSYFLWKANGAHGSKTMMVLEDTGILQVGSYGSATPQIKIHDQADDAGGPELVLNKQRGAVAADGQDNDIVGSITFTSYDDGTPSTQTYANIKTTIADATSGQEAGLLAISVAEYDGTVTPGLILDGDTNANGEVDVTIGAGVGSTTQAAGNFYVNGTILGVSGSSGGPGAIRLYEDTDNGSNRIALSAPASCSDREISLPDADGTVALTSDIKKRLMTVAPGNYGRFFYLQYGNTWFPIRTDFTLQYGTGSTPNLTTTGSSLAQQSEAPLIVAISDMKIYKVHWNWFWTAKSGSIQGSRAFEFSFHDATVLNDSVVEQTLSSAIVVTNNNGSFTNDKAYTTTWEFASGNGFTLSAGKALYMFIRCTAFASSVSVFIPTAGTMSIEYEYI